MDVERLSASALKVAMLCLARFRAEYVDRGKGIDGEAGKFGTAIHAALEMFVSMAFLADQVPRTLDGLLEIWKLQHAAHYGGIGENPAEYKLGVTLLTRWFERGDLFQPNREVVSLEVKEHFTIKVSGKPIHFTYIIDRLDRKTDTGAYVVVDYKTSVWALNPDDLRSNVQVRIYALAIQMKYPDAPGVWIEFDYLKHENQPVGIYLSKAENAATFEALKVEIKKIQAAPDDPEPTLNPECLFCPVKLGCPKLQKNILAGGVMAYTPEQLIDLRADLDFQIAAAKAAIREADVILMAKAREEDSILLEGTKSDLAITMRRTRKPEGERIEKLMGPDRWRKYGSASITVAEVEAALKSDEFSAEEKVELRALMPTSYGDPSFKAKKKSAFDKL